MSNSFVHHQGLPEDRALRQMARYMDISILDQHYIPKPFVLCDIVSIIVQIIIPLDSRAPKLSKEEIKRLKEKKKIQKIEKARKYVVLCTV